MKTGTPEGRGQTQLAHVNDYSTGAIWLPLISRRRLSYSRM
jgi:hypothetical protein